MAITELVCFLLRLRSLRRTSLELINQNRLNFILCSHETILYADVLQMYYTIVCEVFLYVTVSLSSLAYTSNVHE